ncbi:uncharacterized protein isoform X1 [Takifugu rubripes]|uniref:uncharacterized protein isoform X1 n=4 Tax=Takifugu rubripes TaxID=31033 RepID=UPI001145AE02|nr:uncharacterized protein LOC115252421 isoform X1 [Takifugu rubripes]
MMTKLVKLEKNYRNKQAKMSENTEDRMAQEEMLDKIAKLHHDSIHLKDLNASLMEWLDAAETENVSLCSDNKSLRKKANMLEKMVSEAQQDRGEPCPPSLADEKRKNVQKIQLMEEQLTLQREDNQQLISELKDLQQQRDEDKKTLSKISQAHQILQRDLEAAHLELQQNDMSIQEKKQLLRNAEKDLEEFFNTIEDLRRTNQELKFQLQERQDESSFAFLNTLTQDKLNDLSYAEEVMQLNLSARETKDAEVLVDPWNFSTDFQQQYNSPGRCLLPRITGKVIHIAFLLLLCTLFFSSLAFVALRYIENLDLLSFQLTQSYCNLHFAVAPPF